MASRDFTIDELAIYLHVTPQQVLKLASRAKIPGRKIKGEWKFSESDVHHWMEDRIGEGTVEDLLKVEELLHKSRRDADVVNLRELFFPDAVSKPLASRTRGAVIREMCDLAASTGLLWDASEMAEAVADREELHPTALENGVAMLHPRRPRSSILSQPIVALGVSSQPLPFGNRAGHLTDIFFLICSTDDSVHLKILARLSRLISDNGWLQAVRGCDDSQSLYKLLLQGEERLTTVPC